MELTPIQAQRLNQRQIQWLELLQMSSLELRDYLQELAQENPVVDLNESFASDGWETEDDDIQRLRWLADNDWQNNCYHVLDEYETDPIARIGVNWEEDTLSKFIGRQVDRLPVDPRVAWTVRFLSLCLDTDGYLRLPLEEISSTADIPFGQLMAGLEVLQSLDPAGIGAKNLSQCLALQLERVGIGGTTLAIVQDHLEALARGRYHSIATRLKIPLEEVLSAQKVIRNLEPRPGTAFEQAEQASYIYPDVFVVEEAGHFVVRLRNSGEPAFQINGYYRELLAHSHQEDVRAYLRQKIQSAQDVLQAIGQRENTLRRCVQVIVNQQEAFFRAGEEALRPLRMLDIAEAIGVHESTVSRAMREKYLQCQWGVFPLSWFFSRGAVFGDVDGVAARSMLRSLIKQEDKTAPMSDQKLCDEMSRLGCPISRRTVAKYRNELNIPGTSGRKLR